MNGEESLRLAVLADIHDNLPALEAVVEDLCLLDVDGVIGAGDYLMRGPFPQETVDLLRSLDAWLIRGNTDGYVLDCAAGQAPEAWYASEQWAALRWTCRHVDEETLEYVGSLPEQTTVHFDDAEPIRIVHGRPDEPMGRLIPSGDAEALHWFERAGFLEGDTARSRLAEELDGVGEAVVVCGHTHIPWFQEEGGRLVLNPGAVSGSLNEDPRAHYALLTWTDEGWRAEHRAVAYDVGRLATAFWETGYLDAGGAMARLFLLTVETGKNLVGPFFAHVDRVARQSGHDTWSVAPDPVWHRAAATFSWPDGYA